MVKRRICLTISIILLLPVNINVVFVVQYQLVQRYFLLDIICLMMAAWLLSLVDWSLSKRLSRNTRRLEQACLIGMFGEYLEV